MFIILRPGGPDPGAAEAQARRPRAKPSFEQVAFFATRRHFSFIERTTSSMISRWARTFFFLKKWGRERGHPDVRTTRYYFGKTHLKGRDKPS